MNMSRGPDQPAVGDERSEAIRAALEEPRPLRIVLMGPARAGKTLLLWSWKEIVGQIVAGHRVLLTHEFNTFAREIDESLRGAVAEVGDKASTAAGAEKTAVETMVDRRLQGQRTATDSAPPDLVLFEIVPGLPVRTRDWAGEQLDANQRFGEGADEVKSTLNESLEQADALLLVIDAFSDGNAEFQKFVRDHLQFLAHFAAGELSSPRPVAVVTTKFDHSPEFEELMQLAEKQQHGRLQLDEEMQQVAEAAVQEWVGKVLGEPGEEVPLLGSLRELDAEYFPCSAFGRNPSQVLRPALTLAPLRHVIEEALCRRGREILEKRKHDLETALADRQRRDAKARAQRERRQAFWTKAAQLTWSLVALLACIGLASIAVPMWQVSSHCSAGQVAAARVAEWRHLAVFAQPWSPLHDVEAGHLQLLTWASMHDRTLDAAAAEQSAATYFDRLRRHAGPSPWTRQAALIMTLGPMQRARDDASEHTSANALQLESKLASRLADSGLAGHLDSWARRRVAEEQAALLLTALPSSEAVTRLEGLLRRDLEPLSVEWTDKVFAALARRDLSRLVKWTGVGLVLRRLDQYADWLLHPVSDRAVVELALLAARSLETITPQDLEQALSALALADGEFSARFATELYNVLASDSLDRTKARFVSDRDSEVEARLATLFAHPWLREALRGRDHELFTVAARAAFSGNQDSQNAGLLDRMAVVALGFKHRADLAVGSAATLTDADFALLFGRLGEAERRAYIDRYEDLLRDRSTTEHARGLARCIHLLDLVQRHAPAPRLDEELLGEVGGRQQQVRGELAKEALAQIVAGEQVETDLVIRVLADKPSPARQRLVVAVVENAPALPERLFEQIAARVDLSAPKSASERLLGVVVRVNTGRQPLSNVGRLAFLSELLWAIGLKSDVVTFPKVLQRRSRARLRELAGVLLRQDRKSTDPQLRALLEKCVSFRSAEPGLLFESRDRPAVARVLWRGAVAGLGKTRTAADQTQLVARLQLAAALDPEGSEGRVADLAPVLDRIASEPGLRSWLLRAAPALRRHDAGVTAAIRQAAAPALESEAIGLLSGQRRPTSAMIDEAAELLRRAAEFAPKQTSRRIGLIEMASAAAAKRSELRHALYELLHRRPESRLDKALRSSLAPLYEASALAEIAAARIDEAIREFKDAVAIEPGGEVRRAKRFAKAATSGSGDRGYLHDIHEFGRRVTPVEAATAVAVEASVAFAALEHIRKSFRSGRLETVRKLLELLPSGAKRAAVVAHLKRLSSSALVRGAQPFYCSVDLVTHHDYEQWLGSLPATQQARYAANEAGYRGVAVGMRKIAAATYARSLGGRLPTYAQLLGLRKIRSGRYRQLRADFHQWVFDVGSHYAPYAAAPERKMEQSGGDPPGLVAIRVVFDVLPKELQ